MSAICGVASRERQSVNPKIVSPIMARLVGYGPDGCHQKQLGSAILGHQMLHLTPESLGATVPWHDADHDLLITADARLDNRADLFVHLEIPPQVRRELSDSQLILKAYRKWGEDCPKHLLGDFAFAIWNEVEQTLFCARDIMGVRPFYYHASPVQFIFASDINAVLAAPGVESSFYDPMVAAYLQGHDLKWAEKQHTFFKDVVKLPPAHSLTVTPTKLSTRRYWSLETVPALHLGSEQAYIEALHERLFAAVSCRLRCAYPIGAHLSSGLDSSAVAVLAARQLRQQGKSLSAFSWSPPLTDTLSSLDEEDERALIEQICEEENIKGSYISLNATTFAAVANRNFMTEPQALIPREQHVQWAAGRQHIRLLLSGWGGDEAITFNGRGRWGETFLKGHWPTLWQEGCRMGRHYGRHPLVILAAKLRAELMPNWLYELWLTKKRATYKPVDCSKYIQPRFAKRNRAAMQPLLQPTLRTRPGIHRQQRKLLNHGHITKRLEDWAISGGQQGLVYSYPLLDQRLLEFAVAIPSEYFYKNGWGRYLFRTATAGILPDGVRWKKNKDDYALNAKHKQLVPEVKQLAKSNNDAGFEAARQLEHCQDYLDMTRLHQAQTGKREKEPGFDRAMKLAAIMGHASQSKLAMATGNLQS